jgi:hypothetical protein
VSFDTAMPGAGATEPSAMPSVFLSYASEDREAARALRDGLAAEGLEVWYDENELTGGDAWDQKIRRQIRECDYFMPIISAQSEARREGYFRREWRLAVERTLDMADDHLFLLPVVIDDTAQGNARVPERFMSVQWLRVPGGQATPALKALCTRIVTGETVAPPPPKRPPLVGKVRAKAAADEKPAARSLPPFPEEEPGKKAKFYFLAAEWLVKAAWIKFQALPRFIRLLVYLWLVIAVLTTGRPSAHTEHISTSAHDAVAAARSAATAAQIAKLGAIAKGFEEGADKGDLSKLGSEVAREFESEAGEKTSGKSPILAIRFTAPAATPAEVKVADSTFALLYGRLSIATPGKVGLGQDTLAPLDPPAAQLLGRANHAQYVVYGGVESKGPDRVLTITVEEVDDATITWTKSYPIATADPEAIAPEVEKAIPKPEED